MNDLGIPLQAKQWLRSDTSRVITRLFIPVKNSSAAASYEPQKRSREYWPSTKKMVKTTLRYSHRTAG